jgi:hypothetical protein
LDAKLTLLARSNNPTGTLETVSDEEPFNEEAPPRLKARYVTTDPAVNRLLGLTESQLDINNIFFKRLGTNNRTCASCHYPSAAWTIAPVQLQAVFNAAVHPDGSIEQDHLGLSGVFEPITGANCPTPASQFTSFASSQTAYSGLLNHGLIRNPINLPAGAEFTVTTADPFACASNCGNGVGPACAAGIPVSEYRKPLITANFRSLSTILWDGRSSILNSVNITSPACAVPPCAPPPACTTPPCLGFGSIQNVENNATSTHAQTAGLTSAQEQTLTAFQFQNIVAQTVNVVAFDSAGNPIAGAGDLTAEGARGGPNALQAQRIFIGQNDNFGNCIDATINTGCRRVLAPLGSGVRDVPFNPNVFTIYNAWNGNANPARASIARGQSTFNTRTIQIRNVAGINDEPAFCAANPTDSGCTATPQTGPTLVNGSCTTCHDAPNFGSHTIVAALNIGLVDPQPASASAPIGGTTPGTFLPLYTVTCNATGDARRIATGGLEGCTLGGLDCTAGGPVNTNPARGALPASTCGSIQVTDLGNGGVNGRFKRIGRFKGSAPRAVAARGPVFHNGFGTDPGKAVDFYAARFTFVPALSAQDRADLINFLNAL